MTDATTSSDSAPYRESALIYFSKGWTDVFPLGRRGGPQYAKEPVPVGVTGYDAKPVGWQKIHSTVHSPAGLRNVAVRMPRHIICLDVDQYEGHDGLTTLRKAEANLGPLPATWRNSARGLTESGHRYFRLPVGMLPLPGAEEILEKAYGPNIEILHYGRRYAVVWPSLNPSAGLARYEWYRPDGEVAGCPPAVIDIPLLPDSWVALLAVKADSPEASRRGGNLRAPRGEVKETEPGDDLFDEVRQTWRRSLMEIKVREHLSNVLHMTDGTVNKTLGSAGIAFGRYAAAGLFTLEQAQELIEAAARKNGVHSDDWNRRNRKSWTLDSRIRDALSQGINKEPIQIIDDQEPADVYGFYLAKVRR